MKTANICSRSFQLVKRLCVSVWTAAFSARLCRPRVHTRAIHYRSSGVFSKHKGVVSRRLVRPALSLPESQLRAAVGRQQTGSGSGRSATPVSANNPLSSQRHPQGIYRPQGSQRHSQGTERRWNWPSDRSGGPVSMRLAPRLYSPSAVSDRNTDIRRH